MSPEDHEGAIGFDELVAGPYPPNGAHVIEVRPLVRPEAIPSWARDRGAANTGRYSVFGAMADGRPNELQPGRAEL